MPNRLQHESSPYLLQHAHNPVDWYPWGAEALQRARSEQRPIFLSIGYSACHWCHVMEHESFENPQIAALMNDHYVNIKVDREERPDLDQIYMQAVQLLTGRGGWPMSVFLTPDLQPFYGGTYWPPTTRQGMPGFDQVLLAVEEAWRNRRPQALAQAQELTAHLQRSEQSASSAGPPLDADLLLHAAATLERAFDFQHGGFGRAPKFPHPMDLRLLLRVWRRERREGLLQMVTTTLDKMAAGGIYDQLGGGFHRYSVDERWLVPHFEKMLYDNALLVSAYVEAFQVTRNPEYERIVRETCDYILREMTDPAGGFYSTEDADSEGEEGKFYVWTPGEIQAALGSEAAATFCYLFDVTESGNFEGHNIVNLPKPIEQCAAIRQIDPAALREQLAAAKDKLLALRNQRVRPGRDDKVLASWNGLMLDALAQAANSLNEPRYYQAAKHAADFLLHEMRRPDGRLLHTWRAGVAKLDAFLDDYAACINGLISVYEAGFEERYLDAAAELADQCLARFLDREQGGCFFTADDHESLITRPKDWHDSSVPSGNALFATALLRLGHLTGSTNYLTVVDQTLRAAAPLMEQSPTAMGQMLLALDAWNGPLSELVLLGDATDADFQTALTLLRKTYLPNRVLAVRSHDSVSEQSSYHSPLLTPLFAGKSEGKNTEEKCTLFVCQNFACQAPRTDLAAITAEIEHLSQG